LIATVALQGEILERQIPHGFQPFVHGNPAPERAVERAVIVMQPDQPRRSKLASLARLHSPTIVLRSRRPAGGAGFPAIAIAAAIQFVD
jgi:hypothetical protein